MKKSTFLSLSLFLLVSSSLVWAEANSASSVAVSQLMGSETCLLPTNYDIWSCDWAPDGKALIFAGKIKGEDSTKIKIWQCSLNPATEPTMLTNTDYLFDYSPRWSTDGTRVVMSRRTYGKDKLSSSIWMKEVASGEGKQLTNGPVDQDPFWSPKGGQIVFSRMPNPYKGSLVIANLQGEQTVLAEKDGELLQSPWWGSNGLIYFTKFNPQSKNVAVAGQKYQVMQFGKGSIWAIDPEKKQQVPVVNDEYDNRLPALSPDGTRLAFVSNRQSCKDGHGKYDRGSLYIKNLTNNEVTFITNKVGLNGGSLSWAPDGKRLAFFTFRSIRPAIWVINIP